MRDIVVGNLYSLNNDTALLREAYDIVTEQERHTDVRDHLEARFLYASLLSQEAVSHGKRNVARYYVFRDCRPIVDRVVMLFDGVSGHTYIAVGNV